MRSVNQGRNQYCVPAMLSILTGKTTDECEEAIQKVTRNYGPITGVRRDDWMRVMNQLGFVMEKQPVRGYSMYGCLVALVDNGPKHYIVAVPKHVVVIEVTEDKKIWFCDNHTKEPINAASAARLGQKVEEIFTVVPKPTPILVEKKSIVEDLIRTYTIRETWSDGNVKNKYWTIRCYEEN